MVFHLNSVIALALQASLALFCGIYLYSQWCFQYWKKRNTPYAEPEFPTGSVRDKFKTFGENLHILYKEMKEKGVKDGTGLFVLTVPSYLLLDPDKVKYVLVQDFSNFSDRIVGSGNENDPIRENFVFYERERWHPIRTKVLQAFTPAKLKTAFDYFLSFGYKMEKLLEELHEKSKPVNLKQISECFTTDVLGSYSFGVTFDSLENPNSKFRVLTRNTFDNLTYFQLMKIAIIIFYPKLRDILGLSFYKKRTLDFFSSVIGKVLKFRKDKENVQKNLLEFMVRGKCEDDDDEMKQVEQVTADVFALLAAGSESTASTIAFCLYELGRHPSIQEKVRQEVKNVLNEYDGKITYEALWDMKYLNQVLNETLRMYPSISFLYRTVKNDCKLPGTDVVLEKDIFVYVSVLGLHNDPEYFPEPDKFDPDRFSEENAKKISPYTFLPFGDGPRNCLGYKFGILMTKLAVVTFIKNYKFTLNPETRPLIRFDNCSLTLVPKDDLLLDIERVR